MACASEEEEKRAVGRVPRSKIEHILIFDRNAFFRDVKAEITMTRYIYNFRPCILWPMRDSVFGESGPETFLEYNGKPLHLVTHTLVDRAIGRKLNHLVASEIVP